MHVTGGEAKVPLATSHGVKGGNISRSVPWYVYNMEKAVRGGIYQIWITTGRSFKCRERQEILGGLPGLPIMLARVGATIDPTQDMCNTTIEDTAMLKVQTPATPMFVQSIHVHSPVVDS